VIFFSRIWRDRRPYSKFIETEQKNREYKKGEGQRKKNKLRREKRKRKKSSMQLLRPDFVSMK
jgi:hypothetical protein